MTLKINMSTEEAMFLASLCANAIERCRAEELEDPQPPEALEARARVSVAETCQVLAMRLMNAIDDAEGHGDPDA